MKTKQEVIEVLKKVDDPELGIDIWTLGLIYNIDILKDNKVGIRMTYTTPFCPYGPQLLSSIKNKIKEEQNLDAEVEVVFTPPWEMPEEIRRMMGV